MTDRGHGRAGSGPGGGIGFVAAGGIVGAFVLLKRDGPVQRDLRAGCSPASPSPRASTDGGAR